MFKIINEMCNLCQYTIHLISFKKLENSINTWLLGLNSSWQKYLSGYFEL